MSLIKWTPLYDPFFDVDRGFDELATMRGSFSPALDLYEKGNNVVVEVALAGMDPEKVKIEIEDNILNIEGTQEKRSEVDEKNYYRKEVRTGSFHRVITLPSFVDGDKATAEYDKGILTITMPKREELKSKPLSIKIKK